jgi:hypothetical protein
MDAKTAKNLLDKISITKEKLRNVENKISINNMKIGHKNEALNESNMLLIVLPFLESLGWKIYEGDIILECKILPDNLKFAQKRRRVDIGLLDFSKHKDEEKYEYKVLIELKKGTITKNSRKQLSRYMVWSKTKYGILVSRDALELFYKRVGGKDKDGAYQQYHCFIFNWVDLKQYHDVLRLVSKDFMLNGYTDNIVKELYKTRPWEEYFRKQVEQSEFNNDKAFTKGIEKKGWEFNSYTANIRLQYIKKIISDKLKKPKT